MKWFAPALAAAALAAFGLWWLDPSHAYEREARAAARAARVAQDAALAQERAAFLAPLITAALALVIVALALAAVATLALWVVGLRRRVTSWRPDAHGMVPLSDAQREQAAILLAEGHQDVRRIAAGTAHPRLTQQQIHVTTAEQLRELLAAPAE